MYRLPEIITEHEFLEGVARLPHRKHRAALFLAFYQCLRVSEVSKLKKEDISLEKGFLRIRMAKGDKDRDIPIMPPVVKWLRYIPIGLGDRQLQRIVKKVWPQLHFHCLRHSGATYYLNDKKMATRHIQQLLGHSRLDTTQIYTHVNPSQLKEAFQNAFKE